MIKNMGFTDRLLRISLALFIIILFLTNVISGTVAVITGIVAALFLITGFAGVCPAYMLLNINTNKKDS